MASIAIALLASAAQTGTGAGSAIDLGTNKCVRLYVDVSAVSGTTPSLAVTIETSRDAINWVTLIAYPAIAATGSTKRTSSNAQRYVRAKWAITGTSVPTFTFSVGGESLQSYATTEQLAAYGLPDAWLSGVSEDDKAWALIRATADADGYLDGRYTLPLLAWGEDLSGHVADIARWYLMNRKGRNPENQNDPIDKAYDIALKWLMQVRDNEVTPVGIVDSSPVGSSLGGIEIDSEPLRGWGC